MNHSNNSSLDYQVTHESGEEEQQQFDVQFNEDLHGHPPGGSDFSNEELEERIRLMKQKIQDLQGSPGGRIPGKHVPEEEQEENEGESEDEQQEDHFGRPPRTGGSYASGRYDEYTEEPAVPMGEQEIKE